MTEKTEDPLLPKLLADYGQLLIKDDPRRAEELLQRAVKLGDAADPKDSEIAYPLTALGELYLNTSRATMARPLLERALVLRASEGDDGDAEAYANTELLAAKVLWTTPKEQARALELATSAKARLEKASLTKKKPYALVSEWLAARSK
jgi:hypothetical protein